MTSKIKTVLFVLLLTVACVPYIAAQTDAVALKQTYTDRALQALASGDFKAALAAAEAFKELDPTDPLGYYLAVQTYWRSRQISSVVFEVYYAERDHGVRDLRLYKEQATALFILGGYQGALQALDKAEDLMLKKYSNLLEKVQE